MPRLLGLEKNILTTLKQNIALQLTFAVSSLLRSHLLFRVKLHKFTTSSFILVPLSPRPTGPTLHPPLASTSAKLTSDTCDRNHWTEISCQSQSSLSSSWFSKRLTFSLNHSPAFVILQCTCFLGCVTTYHKFSSFKQRTFLPHSFCRSGVRAGFSWVLCWESQKAAVSHGVPAQCGILWSSESSLKLGRSSVVVRRTHTHACDTITNKATCLACVLYWKLFLRTLNIKVTY